MLGASDFSYPRTQTEFFRRQDAFDHTQHSNHETHSTIPQAQQTARPNWLAKTCCIFTTVGFPCALISVDMGYTDVQAIISLRHYFVNNNNTAVLLHNNETGGGLFSTLRTEQTLLIVKVLWYALFIMYLVSCLSLLFSPVISSLKMACRTSLRMADAYLEQTAEDRSLGEYFLTIECPNC